MLPGVYHDLTNEKYHGGPGINKSLLDLVNPAPARALYALTSEGDKESTAAQKIGTALHSLVLEPDDFAARYVLAPKFDRRTKAGKEAAAAFEAEHAGKITVDPDDWVQLHAMRDAVMAHPGARHLLTSGQGFAELSVYWTDEATGELCRCRPDWWRADGILVDLKTTEDASKEGFRQSVVKWGYHVQAPYYLDGTEAAHRAGHAPEGFQHPTAFAFIAVEKKPPHLVAVYDLDAESMDVGRAEYRDKLDALAECKRTGAWPGYGDERQTIGLPEWFLKRAANDNDEIEISYV